MEDFIFLRKSTHLIFSSMTCLRNIFICDVIQFTLAIVQYIVCLLQFAS